MKPHQKSLHRTSSQNVLRPRRVSPEVNFGIGSDVIIKIAFKFPKAPGFGGEIFLELPAVNSPGDIVQPVLVKMNLVAKNFLTKVFGANRRLQKRISHKRQKG